MHEFICRLRNYKGSILDAASYVCENKIQAELKYMQRLINLGISDDISKDDYISVELV